MGQNTARHDPRARSDDEDDVVEAQPRQPAHQQSVRPRQPADPSADGGGVGPDEPDDGEFELIGDDDLGAADLGPAAPNTRDPDAGSGPMRKITR